MRLGEKNYCLDGWCSGAKKGGSAGFLFKCVANINRICRNLAKKNCVCVCFSPHYCVNVWSWLIDISRRCDFSVRCQYNDAEEEGSGMERAPDTSAVFHLSRAAFVGWFGHSRPNKAIPIQKLLRMRLMNAAFISQTWRQQQIRILSAASMLFVSLRWGRKAKGTIPFSHSFCKCHLFIYSIY